MKKIKTFILLLCLFVPLAITGCENKNKTTLSTPNIVEIKGGTIIFDPVEDAEYYTISINDYTVTLNASQSSNVQIIDNQINFDASNIFVVGNSYSVKVKANASKKNSSKYSTTYSYKHNGNIEKPQNLKINGTTLTWDVVENASYYIVKIITPNDTILFDKNGNILDATDPESISNADLTEYSFNTNQFDFSSLLAVAGNYKFYVCAVLSSGTDYVESGYTTTSTYTHYITLEIPTNGVIKKVGNSIHMLTAIDTNANAISIECNGIEKTAEINGAEQSITLVSNNLLDINLTQFFQSITNLNLENIAQFAFKTKAKYISNSPETSFYIDSEFSDFAYFDNTHTLSTPTLTVEKDLVNDCYVASWSCEDKDLISGYTLVVCTPSEVKEYSLNSNIESKLIYDNFISIAIQAKGVGNYLTSTLSDFVSNPELVNSSSNLSGSVSNNTLSWNNIENAYYIVEFANGYSVLNTNSYEIDTTQISERDYSINVTAIQADAKHITKNFDLTLSQTLATPTIGYSQGFSSSNLYELTFTGVDNAIGYYIYLKTKDATEFEKIDNLYTTTTIDLTKYICSEGNYTDYEVKIQAVADIHSLYVNSALSRAITVSHVQILDKPAFYKINDTILPISKQIAGNTTKYILKFYGVESAGSYELLINYNKITVPAKNSFYTGIYEIDISNYLIAANNYEIKVRAIPATSSINIQSSEYNVANYALTKQLAMVTNIQVTENEGVYTLSFNPIDNAYAYRVRIVKENDSNYVKYLNDLGLSNSFEITQSVDVTDYLIQRGSYYFYITALAPKQNSYYADAIESTTFGYVNKMTTLNSPTNITYTNLTKNSYLLNWTGDEHADYYLVKITDPRSISHEFKVYNAESTDINKYMTVQGTYTISIYSMINPTSENAKEYASSSATNVNIRYIYQSQRDFERYSVYMYGGYYDFMVEDALSLKNLLWYHYLYEIDSTTNLTMMLTKKQKENGSTETMREVIERIAQEANDLLLYNFNNDEQWLSLANSSTTTDSALFSYLCQKLLEIYPEYNVLEGFNVSHSANSQVFELYYRNGLNAEKVEATKTFTNTNYGNEYSYIDLYSRKSATGAFAIDAREEELVTTTEQLLQAVQHNRKPKFVGESETAELVYNNAKLVLSAIITNNMSETEKVNAIFNWLSASFDLTYYSISNVTYITGSIEQNDISTYGLSKIYYLEGIFENIEMLSNGDLVIGSNLATSKSYSKAFALLCAIEGIESVVINGTYETTIHGTNTTVNHTWNKVLIDTSIDNSGKNWYAVDLTFSDNRIYFNDLTLGYGISSHTYFLTTDSYAELNLGVKDMNYVISNTYETNRTCDDNSYDYYSNSSFGLTYNEISNTIFDFEDSNTKVQGFEYSLNFYNDHDDSKYFYQQYAKTTGYGELQSFLLNTMIYAKHNADNNTSRKSMFEFKFDWDEDNNGINAFDVVQLRQIFDSAPGLYSLRLRLLEDANGSVYTVEDSENKTTTVVYIVEKTA
ncbi:MAG: hypothetical protein IJ415_00065 [Clostridia bacterium]|nr:hypothetical protein [Clostridia bacterium]